MKKGFKKQSMAGFTLIEIMIALAITGVGTAVVLAYQSNASTGQDTQNAVNTVQTMMGKTHSYIGSSGTYFGMSAAMVNTVASTLSPLVWDGTNIRDPNGNIMNWIGNASGAAASYVVTYGGATKPITKEACAQFASGFLQGADAIYVGGTTTPVTTTNGIAGAGNAYKTALGVVNAANLATGCADTSPVVVIQMH